jgi:hypothetical protein
MLKQRRFITLWLLLIAVSLSAFAQEKVLLQNKAQAGQTVRYRLSGTVSIEAAGKHLQLGAELGRRAENRRRLVRGQPLRKSRPPNRMR